MSKKSILNNGDAALIALNETRIEQAGVMRCCLVTVGNEYIGEDGDTWMVKMGAQSKCDHCNTPFTLAHAKPHAKWMPDWVLDKANV